MKNLMILTVFAAFMAFAQSVSAFCGDSEKRAVVFLFEGKTYTAFVSDDMKVQRTAYVDVLGQTMKFSAVEDEERNVLVSLNFGKGELQGRARSFFRCHGGPMYALWGNKDLSEEEYQKISKTVYEISDAAKKKTP